MKELDLEFCPFCRGTNVYASSYRAGYSLFAGAVSCHTCGATIVKVLEHTPDVDEDGAPSDLMEELLWDDILEEARDMAIDAWNTRAV